MTGEIVRRWISRIRRGAPLDDIFITGHEFLGVVHVETPQNAEKIQPNKLVGHPKCVLAECGGSLPRVYCLCPSGKRYVLVKTRLRCVNVIGHPFVEDLMVKGFVELTSVCPGLERIDF
jgi:hypothetical protein